MVRDREKAAGIDNICCLFMFKKEEVMAMERER